MRQFLRCWWLNTWKIMTVIDYCMNENNNDSYSCGGELYYKSQQPFSALIIFCMMANYTLLNMFFTLSDIVIRLKKSTIPDWYPSRKSKVSTMFYNSICTSSSNVDLIKLGFSATEPVWTQSCYKSTYKATLWNKLLRKKFLLWNRWSIVTALENNL